MTSYFEIAGRIIECEDHRGTPGSWSGDSWTKHRAETHSSGTEGVWIGDSWYSNKAISESRSTSNIPSLSEHWFKTSFHVVRELGQLDRRQQIYFMKNPYHFAGWGIGKISEVIEMHWDYNKQRQMEHRGY